VAYIVESNSILSSSRNHDASILTVGGGDARRKCHLGEAVSTITSHIEKIWSERDIE